MTIDRSVHVYCDGGWSHEAGVGSWAYRSKYGRGHGPTRLATSSNEAELEAVCLAVERFGDLPAEQITIHTDNTAAQRWATGPRMPNGAAAAAMRERIDEASRAARAKIVIVHSPVGTWSRRGIGACHDAASRALRGQTRGRRSDGRRGRR